MVRLFSLAAGLVAASMVVPLTVRAQTSNQIAFARDSDDGSQIWIMNRDGSGEHALTSRRGLSTTPAWSPDGTRIVFADGRRGNWDLFTMRADGRDVVRLTDTDDDEFDPVWCPDGKWIVFEGNAARNWDVYVMPAAGGQAVNLTDAPADDFDPTCSPDSQTVAYATGDRRDSDIRFVPLAFPGLSGPILSGPQRDSDPYWSRGNEIVFSREGETTRDVYVTSPEGDTVEPIIRTDSDESSPVLTDDGRILYVRTPEGSTESRIHIVNRKTKARDRLTDADHDSEPAPRPSPTTIAGIPRLDSPLAQLFDCKWGGAASNIIDIRGSFYTCAYGRDGGDVFYATDGYHDYVSGGGGPDHAYVDNFRDDVYSAAVH